MILASEERIERYVAKGWWGTTTLWQLFLRNVEAHPDALAAADPSNREELGLGAPRRLNWQALAAEVDRFSLLLLDEGLQRDEAVITQLPNGLEQFVVYLACARLGLIVSPVPVQYREHELRSVLALTGAAAVVTFEHIGPTGKAHATAQMWRQLQNEHRGMRRVLAWQGNIEPRLPALTDLGKQRLLASEAAAAVTANDIFTVCWTSGTEASPKGIPRSHNDWLAMVPAIIEAGQIAPGARLLNPFPMINMAGIATAFAVWLVLGASVIQHQPFSLPVFLAQLRDESIDYTVAPPAILNALLQNDALVQGIDFQRLKRIGSGSSPLSEWMVRGFQERHGVHIINYFGSNEGASLAGSDRSIPDPGLRAQFFPRADAAEEAATGVRTRLVDPDTEEEITEPGRVGELRFDGPTIFSGYFRSPELTAQAFDDQGFYKSGDLFEIADHSGRFFRYVGRSKDLVIRGGMNISSEEVEALLLAHPKVREAAVVAVPDMVLGEKVCACVVPAPGESLSLQSLMQFLHDECQIAIYKCPEYLLVLDELPRNAVGKVLKRVLRERARSLPAQAV
ncbi:TPA: class I adenylate-forming enzyme family protein [Pseudomonas aeruginosa]